MLEVSVVIDTIPRRFLRSLFLLTIVMLVGSLVLAQENEDCLMCHEDPDMTGEIDGKEVSVFVDVEDHAASVHSDMECVLCHMDVMDVELPHEDDLELVDCGMCHDDEKEMQTSVLSDDAEVLDVATGRSVAL